MTAASTTYRIVFCAVFLFILSTGWGVVSSSMPEAPDCDVELIKKGVSSITSISDTLDWWHGTWVGQVPFWRPLTSYVFYIESRLIGFDNWSMMMTVSFILHLIFVGCFLWFANYLSNKWLALAAVSWFAAWRWPLAKLSLPYWLCIVPAKSTALRAWKDQPDILVGIFIILACVFAMRKKWLIAIFASVIAVCFKESGWLAFPLAAIAVIARERGVLWLKSIPTKEYLIEVFVVLMLITARYLSGPEVFRGYHMGTNTYWLHRLSGQLGYFIAIISTFAWPYAVFSLTVLLSLLTVHQRILKVAAVLVILVATAWYVGDFNVVSGFYILLDPECHLFTILRCMLWVGVAWLAISDQRNRFLIVSLVVMVVIATLPYVAATQVQEHVLYLSYALQSFVVVIALKIMCERVYSRFKNKP